MLHHSPKNNVLIQMMNQDIWHVDKNVQQKIKQKIFHLLLEVQYFGALKIANLKN